MAHAGFETFHGKQIFFIDFKGATPAQTLATSAAAQAQIARCPPSSVLTLTDITNAVVDDSVTDAMKRLAKSNKPFVKAAAVVGVTGLRKVIFSMVILFTHRQMSLFDDHEAAQKWLAAQ